MNATYLSALRLEGRQPVPRQNVSPKDRELVRLKGRLLCRITAETNNPVLQERLRQAAVEAESLAWLSPFPLLILPVLLEEKVREVRLHAMRQGQLLETGLEWQSLAE